MGSLPEFLFIWSHAGPRVPFYDGNLYIYFVSVSLSSSVVLLVPITQTIAHLPFLQGTPHGHAALSRSQRLALT